MAIGKSCWVQAAFALLAVANSDDTREHRRHHHGHHHHRGELHIVRVGNHIWRHDATTAPRPAANHSDAAPTVPAKAPERMVAAPVLGHHSVSATDFTHGAQASDALILRKMERLEKLLGEKEESVQAAKISKGHLNVNGPLPPDFSDRFAQGVADATGCRAADVELVGAAPQAAGAVEEIMFRSRSDIVAAVEDQATDPDSKLAKGILHSFLVARGEPEDQDPSEADEQGADVERDAPEAAAAPEAPEVDLSMPYGDLEPFGREDTAQELTEASIRESNAMVDQLERAEVAEEKRSVFRALTRLRGAAITSFDGIARSQTGNIDDYARKYQWREGHPVHHLADDEADVSKWAFPDSDGERN